jgi:hypothetical protein
MDLEEIVEFWKQDIPFEQKAKLYYEKVEHIIDDEGGYRPVNFEYRKQTMWYFKDDGQFEVFDDYTLDSNRVIERKDGGKTTIPYILNGYLTINVSKNGKRYGRRLSRAMLSTFLGPPPDVTYTADHIGNERKLDDDLTNLRWLDRSGQNNNRTMPEMRKSTRIIANELFPDNELTAKEWTHVFTKPNGTKYFHKTISRWARTKENGFSYKTYNDLIDEEWKLVGDPEKNHVEISNKSRVKDVMLSASGREEHVLSADQLSFNGGYPSKRIDGELRPVHVLVFQLWYPELWKNRNPGEKVLHKKDNRLDFRPENLRLGTPSENGKDAHDNGKYDGKQTARQPCIAYDGDKEVGNFKSLLEAARYLVETVKKLKFKTAFTGIYRSLDKDKSYKGFMWKSV